MTALRKNNVLIGREASALHDFLLNLHKCDGLKDRLQDVAHGAVACMHDQYGFS